MIGSLNNIFVSVFLLLCYSCTAGDRTKTIPNSLTRNIEFNNSEAREDERRLLTLVSENEEFSQFKSSMAASQPLQGTNSKLRSTVPFFGKPLLAENEAQMTLEENQVKELSTKENEWLHWHSSSLLLHSGNNYQLGESDRKVISFEHAHGWKYGDNFFFVDVTHPEGRPHDYYGEISPRLSLGKISGRDLSFGPLKDISIGTTTELGTHLQERWLAGFAFDFDLPGFQFFRLETMYRDDPSLAGDTWQITTIWNAPFEIGRHSFLFEGFVDYAGAEGDGEANIHGDPRLLYDLGSIYGKKGKAFFGIEYVLWYNKFGVDGVNEHVPQLTLKVTF